MICKCPAGAALPDVPAIKCSESFGQVQKVAFQRLMKDDGSKNSFTSEKAITALASWTPLLSAADSTKIVVSPYIQAPTAEAGAARRFGRTWNTRRNSRRFHAVKITLLSIRSYLCRGRTAVRIRESAPRQIRKQVCFCARLARLCGGRASA